MSGPDTTVGLFNVHRRLVFENGWTVDVHKEEAGETLYQRWAPGVKRQSVFGELYRQPSDWFNKQIARQPHEVMSND